MSTVAPPRWSTARLDADRRTAVARFREERMTEPLEQYVRHLDAARAAVAELLERTDDLAGLDSALPELIARPRLAEALRYLTGPFISEADLCTVAEVSLAPARLRADPDGAARVAATIRVGLDRHRFGWAGEGRRPTAGEREAAVLASAALIATQRTRTARANGARERQEEAVARALREAGGGLLGLTEVATPQEVPTLDRAPGPGEFCRETKFGTRKADLVVGLWDGRRMPIECKVSNSSVNSIKRLNNDVAAKATTWTREFGSLQAVPAAVLSGVYALDGLERAQAAGLTIFWAHELGALTEFLSATR